MYDDDKLKLCFCCECIVWCQLVWCKFPSLAAAAHFTQNSHLDAEIVQEITQKS